MYQALSELADALRHRWPWAADPAYAASVIRQIHIATGCSFLCAHCFASPKRSLMQMDLAAFSSLAGELRVAAMESGSRAPFLFLGSETDPSMVEDYAQYLDTWIQSQIDISRVWIFTHGWQLTHPPQWKELDASIAVIRRNLSHIGKVMLSIDAFSLPARRGWDRYLANTSENLRLLSTALPIESIGLEVLYPPEAPREDSPERLAYWKSRDSVNYDMIESTISDRRNEPGASLTLGLAAIGRGAGVACADLLRMAKDCGYPFASGRARRFYTQGRHAKEASLALQRQRVDVLHPLEGFSAGFEGVMIYPDGRVRCVDYLGYQLGEWLNEGRPVITSLIAHERDLPW